MKFALVNGKRTHINDVPKGTIGYDCWFNEYKVKACKGHYMQYWKYADSHPVLPKGYENETEWHQCWKSVIKDEYCEVVCGENKEHRADILTNDYTIEIQYSPIEYETALERTKFYFELKGNRTIWIVNAYKPYANNYIITELDKEDKERKRFFIKWKYPKKWAVDISHLKNANVFLDISPTARNLILLWKHKNILYGQWVLKNKFFSDYLKSYSNCINNFEDVFKNLNLKDYL